MKGVRQQISMLVLSCPVTVSSWNAKVQSESRVAAESALEQFGELAGQ